MTTETVTPMLYLNKSGQCVCGECAPHVEGFANARRITRGQDTYKAQNMPDNRGFACALCDVDFYGWSGLMEDAEFAASNAVQEGLHASRADMHQFLLTYVSPTLPKYPAIFDRLTTRLWNAVVDCHPNVRVYPGHFGAVLIWQEAH